MSELVTQATQVARNMHADVLSGCSVLRGIITTIAQILTLGPSSTPASHQLLSLLPPLHPHLSTFYWEAWPISDVV